MAAADKRWLDGHYPPDVDAAGGWDEWSSASCTLTCAPRGWVAFRPGHYSEAEVRSVLERLAQGLRRGGDQDP